MSIEAQKAVDPLGDLLPGSRFGRRLGAGPPSRQ